MQGSVRKKGNNWYYRIDIAYVNGSLQQIERYAGKALSPLRAAIKEYETTAT